MRKKIIIVGSCIFIILLIVMVIVFLITDRTVYRVEVSMVDDRSPDRILTVYNNKDEKIEVKRIEFLNGILLCNGYNTIAYYGDVEKENTLIIVLKNNERVRAKVVKNEVYC